MYAVLQAREERGEIRNIKRQQTVVLQEGGKQERIAWKVDFSFEKELEFDAWETVYAEAKGLETGEYRLKLKLWRKARPARLEIWKGHYSRPILVEVLE